MEVVLEDGSMSDDVEIVSDTVRWKRDFGALPNSDITSLTDNDITPESAISMNDPVLNGHNTLFEV